MENIYSTWNDNSREDENNSSRRLLKKLRIALLIWLASFVATMIWFYFTPR
ncbi:MAG: hypothetical protein ACOYXT_27830 [Bacteroidota bacterium]